MQPVENYVESGDGWRRKYDLLRVSTEVSLARNTAAFLQSNKRLAGRYDPQKVQAYYRELEKKKRELYSTSSDRYSK
jgi:hypothetical protein